MADSFVSKAFHDAYKTSIDEQEQAYDELGSQQIKAAFEAACGLIGMDNMNDILEKLSPLEKQNLAKFGNVMLMAGFHLGFNKGKISVK